MLTLNIILLILVLCDPLKPAPSLYSKYVIIVFLLNQPTCKLRRIGLFLGATYEHEEKKAINRGIWTAPRNIRLTSFYMRGYSRETVVGRQPRVSEMPQVHLVQVRAWLISTRNIFPSYCKCLYNSSKRQILYVKPWQPPYTDNRAGAEVTATLSRPELVQ